MLYRLVMECKLCLIALKSLIIIEIALFLGMWLDLEFVCHMQSREPAALVADSSIRICAATNAAIRVTFTEIAPT